MQRTSSQEHDQRGIALVPAILIVSGLAIFTVALLTAVLSGSRTVVHQSEDYQVASAVESVAMLTAEKMWSVYVADQGGAAGNIDSFRGFLSGLGVQNAGPGGPPAADAGTNMLPFLGLPQAEGRLRFNDVNVDAVQLVRRDIADATQIFLTVSASTTRGDGIVNPILNRAVQQVYTVEPAEFPGFEFALLANNVNCVFCHARVDNAQRWWNTAPDSLGSFERVKVGTLESLLLRHDVDGSTAFNDWDADSFVAGSLYVRGLAAESSGALITDWSGQSMMAHPFDSLGQILEDGAPLDVASFSPAGDPPGAFENLYLDYPLPYADQVDGYLPDHFPAPFPDDGGIDPVTGELDPSGAGNKRVDDNEFHELAMNANGQLTAGVVNVTESGEVIDSALDYASAVFTGNTPAQSVQNTISGNVVLTGWPDNPIWIDGSLAVDGDLIIQGFVRGEGSIYVRGNIYVPTDLMYADGQTYLEGDTPGSPTGPRTFGVDQDGNKNALALTAGGNIILGDFQRPGSTQPDGTVVHPSTYAVVTGNPDTGDLMQDKWSFPLAEMAVFNRAEWAKTQETLPGPGGMPVQNPGYVEGYIPRYYSYGEDTIIPIYNKGSQYFDPTTGTWLGGNEAPLGWDTSLLTYADPNDPSDPLLFKPNGTPSAVISSLSHSAGWMEPSVYKLSVEYFENLRPQASPMLIDGLLYTNNAIFSIVYRNSAFAGMMLVNGALVAADVGMLVPGKKDTLNKFPNHSPLSPFAIGLQLNYDERIKRALNVRNPFQVQLKRTYWNPTANLL